MDSYEKAFNKNIYVTFDLISWYIILEFTLR